MLDEHRIRSDAIQRVLALREQWVAIPASELKTFYTQGRQVFIKGQQGIFKPAELSQPLSIRTALDSPYTDGLIQGTRVLYDFAPRTREHENDGLKEAAESALPLIYFVQVKRKPNPEYIAFAPVRIVSWDDGARQFLVDLSEQTIARADEVSGKDAFPRESSSDRVFDRELLEKSYAPTIVQRRLHQARFRNEVLAAYQERCAVCILHIRPLLDGAHVVPDRDPKPVVVINEGLALCATHHRAFDAEILRYDSNYRVRVEIPSAYAVGKGERSMLLAFDGRPLSLPSDKNLWPVLR